MKFVWLTDNIAKKLAGHLRAALKKNQRVIWLVPGGSNVPIVVKAMKLIDGNLTKKLVIMQTDERYVSPDSKDCNWHQLIKAGFDPRQAAIYPMIVSANESLKSIASRYNLIMTEQFNHADCIIGQFGIGADGHIAGIKPATIGTRTKKLVVGYQADDFARITMTFAAINKLDVAYTFAYTDSKKHVLKQLKNLDLPAMALPATILNKVPKSIIYNDQLENES